MDSELRQSWRAGSSKSSFVVLAEENSSLSPALVWVICTVPDASSTTECADRHADRRQGGTPLLTFFTFLWRSRYMRSIGNLIVNVCTDSQGTIQRPSAG